MGESKGADLQVAFDRRIRVQFHEARVASDAGALAIRELDEVHLAKSRQEEFVSRSTNNVLAKPSTINEESRRLRAELSRGNSHHTSSRKGD